MKNKRIKLLILENNVVEARAIKKLIINSKYSFSFKVTDKKEHFIENLNDYQPDLIISNYKLSGCTGLEALSILKITGYIIPFIFFTSPVNEETAVKCLKAGASDYILKKQSKKLLPAVINSLKNKSRTLADIQDAEDIKRSEDRYHQFFQRTNEGILRIKILIPVPVSLDSKKQFALILQHSVVAECNDELAKLLGFAKGSDLVGLKINSFTGHNGKEQFEKFKKFSKNGFRIANIIVSESHAEGGLNHFLSNFVGIIEDSNLIGIWAMFRDITEIKKKEEKLHISEERIKLLFDNLPLGVFQMDINGKIILANPSFVKMLGHDSN